MEKTYFAIDLKSFYASVECVERKLDPLTTNLVVADESRSEKTICLAVTPSLKAYGLSGRSRLFEVVQKSREIKARTGKELEYIIAKPRMALYIEYSARIYGIYLKYFSPEDIHVYSIDEVFIDATSYLKFYKTDPESLVRNVIKDILKETGITATAGIAPNLFLCKIAMDIVAKHAPADKNGVRLASLSVKEYRQRLWDHKPITDFWRIGRGIADRLARIGIYTMGDIALRSIKSEDSLYKILGIDAEILIDHAWGIEPCSIKNIKNYKSAAKSVSEGQVLQEAYTFEKGRNVVREMSEVLSQNLKSKELASDLFTLTVSYDRISLTEDYQGQIEADPYGRPAPKASHGSARSILPTSSLNKISEAILSIYDRVTDRNLFVRRFNISAENVVHQKMEQQDLFTDLIEQKKESSLQNTMLEIQRKFGKNAILKASDYTEGATLRERNQQIGGHRA